VCGKDKRGQREKKKDSERTRREEERR